jgi:hypothetical protein
MVAWVLWFGFLYAKMVVEQRAARFREIVTSGPRDNAGLLQSRR